MKKAMLIFFVCLLPALALSAPIKDNIALLKQSVRTVKNTYKSEGISGVAVQVERCYRSSNIKTKCFYMDYTGRILDAIMIEYLNEQYNSSLGLSPYFSDENFYDRAGKYFYMRKNVNMQEANDHLASLHGKIMRYLQNQ